MTPLIRLMAAVVLPVAVLISMTHLVAADQGPGDGFTAGIISALGLTLQYVTYGHREARRRFRQIRFELVLALGFAVGLFAALLPLFTGAPLLASLEARLDVPLVGAVRLTRAMIFDLGIYLAVVGGAMTAIDSLWGATE